MARRKKTKINWENLTYIMVIIALIVVMIGSTMLYHAMLQEVKAFDSYNKNEVVTDYQSNIQLHK